MALLIPNLQQIIHYGYWIMFPLMIIEGPIITVIAGFLSSLGYFNIFVVYFLMVLADLIGDTVYYAIGRWGGKPIINKWGRHIGITAKHVFKIERKLTNNGCKILFFGKLAHGFGTVFLLAAGAAKMSYWRFILFNIMPTLLKSLIFLLIGYYLGHAYKRISVYLDYTAIVMVVLAIIFIIIYLIIKRIAKKYESEEYE